MCKVCFTFEMSSKLYSMKTRFLLPHKFKRIGAFFAPIGFTGWVWGQSGGSARMIQNLVNPKGTIATYHPLAQNQHELNVAFFIITFFMFLSGLFFLILSREKNEDEYTEKLRLESYQFAAIFQFILVCILFIFIALTNSSLIQDLIVESGLLLILLFWMTYLIRFHIVLYFLNSTVNEK